MIGIFLSQIVSGCTDPIHDHFRHIFSGHSGSHDHMLTVKGIVYPMFKMVSVSSLMVQPGHGYAGCLTFCVVGASCPLIIFTAYQKFRRGIFGQVMKQPLLI